MQEPRSFQLFICYPPTHGAAGDGTPWVELVARDRSGFFDEAVRMVWRGPEAADFWRAHGSELRPGRGISVGLHHIRVADNQVRARITSCALLPLPPSWVKHSQASEQPTPTGAHA